MGKKSKTITPREFIRIVRKEPGSIESSRVIPPKIGSKGFGKIRVNRKTSVNRSTGTNR